jgi:SSS family solute:Na+ symporter
MTLLPSGLLGLVFAALIAAIVASMGSKINSIATIFTIDLYKPAFPTASEGHLVVVGRLTAIIALVTAMLTARPLLGNFDQAFQYIQEFTGFFTPGITVIFLLGMFWKRATPASALVAAIGSAVLSFIAKIYWPEIPFMNRIGCVFLMCLALAVITALVQPRRPSTSTIEVAGTDYSTSTSFNLATAAIVAILCALYATWW